MLASWKQLIDDGRMQDGDEDDAGQTARKPVVLVGPATLEALGATVGETVTLTGPLGSLDLPDRRGRPRRGHRLGAGQRAGRLGTPPRRSGRAARSRSPPSWEATSERAADPAGAPRRLGAFGHDPWWLVIIKAVLIFVILVLLTLFNIWWERRVVARMQHRIGPNVHGPVRPAAEPRRRREAGAEGGHHPEGRRQAGLHPGAGDRDRPGVRDLRGDPVRTRGDHVRAARLRSSSRTCPWPSSS